MIYTDAELREKIYEMLKDIEIEVVEYLKWYQIEKFAYTVIAVKTV